MIREVIIVEGRYDKNVLSQLIDATIVDIGGFGVFNNKPLRSMLRRLASERGVVILTDSDGAGMVIRNFLKGLLPPEAVKHAYIPDVSGKERRKKKVSGEGKLGVEGMPPEVLLSALRNAGVDVDGSEKHPASAARITRADLVELGLIGGENSAKKRGILQKRLGLPENLSSKALAEVLTILYSLEEVKKLMMNKEKTEGGGET